MSEEVRGLAAMDSFNRNRLVRRLRSLKLGAGLTPESAGRSSLQYMRLLFGATTAVEAYEMLRAALDAMDARHLHVQALLNAYGGEGLADDIKTRRKNFAEEHGLKESRVFHLEDLALDEMVQILDAQARGEEIKSSRLKVVEPSIEESSADEPTVKELLISFIEATREQTAVQRETNDLLKRLAAAWAV